MSSADAPVIVWLRRDLRLNDNLAVQSAIQSGCPIILLFIIDPALMEKSPDFGVTRLKFMLAALRSLDETLRQEYSRRLLVQRGNAISVIQSLVEITGAAALYFNLDYTPYARKRDEAVLREVGIPIHTFHDRLLVAPGEITTADGKPFTVYTPFKNRWRDYPKTASSPQDYTLTSDHFYDISGLHNLRIPSLQDLGVSENIAIPEASTSAAIKRLTAFTEHRIYAYSETRDRLANPFDDSLIGTSVLSPYIRFGLVSPRQIRETAAQAYSRAPDQQARDSVTKWMDEITWHEFYTHVLWHFPHAAQGNFNRKYDAVKWRDSPQDLTLWKQGQTGYPVVDAAMRQLQATGWMHNRARMIAASFLTKDLLIDWREGERHFMNWLIDGDIAANNGGWQWVAGTGTDAQPYFRIFNPVLQSKKFDPNGVFIRQWLPELRDVPNRFIHEPWLMETPPRNYPPPMIDHQEARERTLNAYTAIKSGEG